MVRGRKSEQKAVAAASEPNPEADERRRLKKLAFKKKMLSDSQVQSSTKLRPSKTVLKHHGKDILRKSQRKNRYLFSFPGLLAPVSGGKIGELTNLRSKNPILYLDFPQGQMKLFGTIVYPKNKYLTLQFSRGGKNVMCDDYFDNMIVFSEAWWIGRKDENPQELQLDFPEEMELGQAAECDFKGGAGGTCDENKEVSKSRMQCTEPQVLEQDSEDDLSDSQRCATGLSDATDPNGDSCDIDEEHDSKSKRSDKSSSKVKDTPCDKQGPLVQARISTLFKKVEEKKSVSSVKVQRRKTKDMSPPETLTERRKTRTRPAPDSVDADSSQLETDDIEEFSGSLKEADESDDEDWADDMD